MSIQNIARKLKLNNNQKTSLKNKGLGNSLAVQWLGLHASTAGGPGSIPGPGTKILASREARLGKEKKT